MKSNTLPKPNGAPETFLNQFGQHIPGIISGFDRLRFRATQRRFFQPHSMESYWATCGVLIKQFDHGPFRHRSQNTAGDFWQGLQAKILWQVWRKWISRRIPRTKPTSEPFPATELLMMSQAFLALAHMDRDFTARAAPSPKPTTSPCTYSNALGRPCRSDVRPPCAMRRISLLESCNSANPYEP